jgi:xanthine dehydrogenase accessory factor
MFNDSAISAKARQLEAEHIPYALATVVRCKSPTSAQPGYKALITAAGDIHGWIGGGCVQPAVIKTARQSLRDGLPQLIRVSPVEDAHPEDDVVDFKSACYSGGSLDIFIEPMLAQPELLIMGSSEVARSLASLAHFAGFTVTVASPGADEAGFPFADKLIVGFDLGDVLFSSDPVVVVATQGMGDQAALQTALAVNTFHLAFIASKRKAARLKQLLKDKGNDPRGVEAIIAPAGLAIGATTPQEIAVSVIAELVAARHVQQGTPAEWVAPNSPPALAEAALSSLQPGLSPGGKETADSGCCGSNPGA